MKPKIALVLGAGSARGLAHIGVLQVLEENRIPFDMIIGSSIGAMVGGIYACKTDIKMLAKMTEQLNLNRFFDVKIPRMGFIAGDKINEFLRLITKKKTFDELIMPVYMVATDLQSGRCVLLKEGAVAEAIRASISIPGVFQPVEKDNMLLVDGAVTHRVPVTIAAKLGADIIIAVDVKYGSAKEIRIKNTLDVILTSIDIMQQQQNESISAVTDVLIQPAVADYSSWDFDKCGELIELGRKAALDKLPELIDKTG